MSSPEPEDREPSPAELDDGEVDAAFASIVSGISSRMAWDVDPRQLDAEADRVATDRQPDPASTTTGDLAAGHDGMDTADDRRNRREWRRAERAGEYAEYLASQQESENEQRFDTEHFVPPEPPPLTRPKARTIWAVVLISLGVLLVFGPNVLAISGDAILVLGLLLVLGGFLVLMAGLRRHRGRDADGWDDGARL